MKRRLGYGELRNRVVRLIQIRVIADLRYARHTPRSGTVRFLLRSHHDFRRARVQHRMSLVDRRPFSLVEYLLRHRLRRAAKCTFESSIRCHTALQIFRRNRLPLPVGFFGRVLAARIATIQRLQFPFITIVTKRYNSV